MPTPTPEVLEQIAHRIYGAVDPTYRQRTRSAMARLHGIKGGATDYGHISGPCDWKIWPALHRGTEKVGTVQDSLNDAINAVSKLLSVDPEPKFDGISAMEAEVRRQFWRARYNDRRKGGSWHMANMQASLSAYLHGWGVARVSMVTDTEQIEDVDRGRVKGRLYQRVSVANHPILRTAYDPSTIDPWQADFVAYMDLVPLQEAVKRWGVENAELLQKCSVNWTKGLDTRGKTRYHEVVPVVEYWSCGRVDDMPTRAVLVGTGTTVHALEYEENPLGERLNTAWRIGVLMTEVGYPMGRAQLAEAHEELLQIVLDDMKAVAERGGAVRVLHNGAFSPETISLMKDGSGDPLTVIEAEKSVANLPPDKLIHDLPPMKHSPVVGDLMTLAQRRQQVALNTNESSRGQFMGRNTPATAYALVNQAQLTNQGLDTYHTLKFLAGQVELVSEMAQFDDSPVTLNILGEQVEFNEPGEAQSQIAKWFEKEAHVLVNGASLTSQDDVARQANQIGQLMQLQPLVAAGTVDPEWWTEQLLHAMQIFDTAARAKNAPASPTAPQPGAMTPEQSPEAGQVQANG